MKEQRKLPTRNADGLINGWLLPIWNAVTDDWRPEQVYLTVVDPHSHKGPHLHMKRHGRFICVSGNVEIITRRYAHPESPGLYFRDYSGDDRGHCLIQVPPGVPAQLVNHDDVPAFVLNMPSPAWVPEDTDDWPVEDWKPV